MSISVYRISSSSCSLQTHHVTDKAHTMKRSRVVSRFEVQLKIPNILSILFFWLLMWIRSWFKQSKCFPNRLRSIYFRLTIIFHITSWGQLRHYFGQRCAAVDLFYKSSESNFTSGLKCQPLSVSNQSTTSTLMIDCKPFRFLAISVRLAQGQA